MVKIPRCDKCDNCYHDKSKKHDGYTYYCKLNGRDIGQSHFGKNSPKCCPLRKEENKMDAIKCFKEKGRLTKDCTIPCNECRLGYSKNQVFSNCIRFGNRYPERFVETIKQWSKDCPAETYKSVLLKAFPKARLLSDDCPDICREIVFGIKNIRCGSIKCDDCWNEPYEEE